MMPPFSFKPFIPSLLMACGGLSFMALVTAFWIDIHYKVHRIERHITTLKHHRQQERAHALHVQNFMETIYPLYRNLCRRQIVTNHSPSSYESLLKSYTRAHRLFLKTWGAHKADGGVLLASYQQKKIALAVDISFITLQDVLSFINDLVQKGPLQIISMTTHFDTVSSQRGVAVLTGYTYVLPLPTVKKGKI